MDEIFKARSVDEQRAFWRCLGAMLRGDRDDEIASRVALREAKQAREARQTITVTAELAQ